MWHRVPVDRALAGKDEMVATLQLGAIGQIARSVEDIAKAEAWYRDVLGLAHMYTYGKLAFFDCGGTRLFLEERSGIEVSGLKNDSVLYFRVPDINAAYDELQSRGVTFVDAPHMIFRHPDGTEEWMTFFRDCDGGILALMSQVSAS
jgi:methylmalonyl-CoA/ethylmalonyl-CoA epimerase